MSDESVPGACPMCEQYTLRRREEGQFYCMNPFCDSNHPPSPE